MTTILVPGAQLGLEFECQQCGLIVEHWPTGDCENCGHGHWTSPPKGIARKQAVA